VIEMDEVKAKMGKEDVNFYTGYIIALVRAYIRGYITFDKLKELIKEAIIKFDLKSENER